MTVTLGNTIGATFLGTIFAAILFGITNLQVYLYFQNYPNDWHLQRISVALLWVLDAIHLSLTVAAMYHYLIDSFGSVLALQFIVWSFKLQIDVNVVIVLLVQTLYGIRVWKLGRHYKRIWPILVAVIIASGYAIGIILAVKTYNVRTFAEIERISWVIYASFTSSTAIDVVIALAMCFYLIKSKSGFSGTNNKIIAIIRMTLISGCLTTACSLAALISYAAMPDTLIFLAIEFLLTKLYINSFLAMLNARQSVRDKDTFTGGSLSISKVMNIRTATSSHGPRSPGAFDADENKNDVPLTPLSEYKHEYGFHPDSEEIKRPADSSQYLIFGDRSVHPMEGNKSGEASV